MLFRSRCYDSPRRAGAAFLTMWQPGRAQWAVICSVALLGVLAWPPDAGRSLGMKAINWLADPRGTLPTLPAPLPMGLDDDGDAVAAHDMEEAAYFQTRERSSLMRWRMDLKRADDPLERSTARQLLVGIGVAAALLVWRMDAARGA